MKRGTQIVYVPHHAGGDLDHPDCEEGFVTSVRGDTIFCRYWSQYRPPGLRTRWNSEGANRHARPGQAGTLTCAIKRAATWQNGPLTYRFGNSRLCRLW